VPSSTLRPLKIMKMRSQSFSATPMSCVEKTMVVPAPLIEDRVLQRLGVDRVEPENGSSRMSSSGFETTAAMNWTFCAMPLDSASIFWSPTAGEPLEPVLDGGSSARPASP
jgi:hypothetical protein